MTLYRFPDTAHDTLSSQNLSPFIRDILSKALTGIEVSQAEGEVLFRAQANDFQAIADVADILRQRTCGNRVGFVINRNINFTNVCYMGCTFCGFAKRSEDPAAEWLIPEQIVVRAREAWNRGATEVCIQGGLHPKMSGTYYREIVLAIKEALPDMHIHAFSPFEVWYGASKTKQSYVDFLQDLKDCGLGSMPGTAAEILDTDIRRQLTRNKLSTEKWVEIIKAAHHVGLPTTATIMYGHIDGPEHWAAHLSLLRDIQKETGGFTELVPLSFVHSESPLYTQNPESVRPGPTNLEVRKMHAIARIMLNGWIDNIQVSWTKLGAEFARELLMCGVNDLGGTLMNESISRSAGAAHGQEITAYEMCQVIQSSGEQPIQRNSIYGVIDDFSTGLPEQQAPLIKRQNSELLGFLSENKNAPAQALEGTG
ncbi:Aminodeoxyfutalosine synthase [Pseudovibrio axinellae]|uniref:Aminodeoxyfutalosine synthase n=1 Tax=Pseudovibrio axinellae TaxID=989403 RepID=A0A165UMB2_9HYPH|nr:5-amino-6-(D-ribitylamino)uracil--L-tyrosine 4-hydroxyphenyl transferase CofH [Pseudovibrio axinellae]KZL12549.1 Aminodeoxyfutalosine synthase [Pseudovibrio axinellae]SEP67400.1 FO synthase subunit 2 [Pseudovibrio axinellae]